MSDQLQVNQNKILDQNGNPVSNAKLYFYQTGTNTPVTVYTDADATIVAAQPVRSNAAGDVIQLYYNAANAVKQVVTTADDVTLFTLDPVSRAPLGGTGANAIGFAPIVGNSATNVQQAITNNTIAGLAATDIDYSNVTYPLVTNVGSMLDTLISGGFVSIGPTTDLDTIIQPGIYVQNDPLIASLALHYPLLGSNPAGAYIVLQVYRLAHGGLVQVCYSAFDTFRRTYDMDITGTYWTSWSSTFTTDIPKAPLAPDGRLRHLNASTRATLAGTVVTVAKAANVASVVRTGVGLYTINFTNAFPDVHYVVSGLTNLQAGTPGAIEVNSRAVGSVNITTRNSAGTAAEAANFALAFSTI